MNQACGQGADGWQVYMLRCSDGSLYTGITTDIARRFNQHTARRGAKYFRGREPVALVYLEAGHDRGSASRREVAIKALSRKDKEALITAAGSPGSYVIGNLRKSLRE